VSAELGLNLDYLVEMIWQYLSLVRVYTKKRGEAPYLDSPLILRHGATVEDVCLNIHKDLKENFKYALVWGTSAKHSPQRVGLNHLLQDEDVVEVHT
jgi:ribosome-interacting GTPase 1